MVRYLSRREGGLKSTGEVVLLEQGMKITSHHTVGTRSVGSNKCEVEEERQVFFPRGFPGLTEGFGLDI